MSSNLTYIIIFTLAIEVLVFVSIYAYKNKNILDEMHGMMVGMTLGMMSGLIAATLYLIPTGNFLNGVIIGSIVGLIFGMPLGKLGGHLGLMEGVMAGPMGGMMGAMLGQMVRPFSIEIFMPFLMFIFLLTMIGITYAVHCKCNSEHCEPGEQPIYKVSDKFLMTWILTVAFLLGLSIFLPFSILGQGGSNGSASASSSNVQTSFK